LEEHAASIFNPEDKQSSGYTPTFQRSMLPLSPGLKTEAASSSIMLLYNQKTTSQKPEED
jgi:hypothetical protein